ncbi:hypothetical protein ABBQ32_008986 [Trebouxia sp. C0010 RCD-2024]
MSTRKLQKILLVTLLGAGLSGFCVYKVVTDQRALKYLADLPSFRDHALTGKHKDSMRKVKLQPSEIACLILSVMVSALANACGVGGGAFFVPMFNILLGFSLKGSTALSQAVVTGGALAGFMYSSSKRHPDDQKQSLIDFDLALILTPMLLLGVTAGVLINAVMPNWLITLLLVLLLTWLTMKTFNKGRQLHSSEVIAQQQQEPAVEHARPYNLHHDTEHDTSIVNTNAQSGEKVLHIEDVATDSYNTIDSLEDQNMLLTNSTGVDTESGVIIPGNSEAQGTHQQPSHQVLRVPWRVVQFAQLSCLWAGFLTLQYGKVSFSQCSWQYAAICSAQAVFSLVTTGLFIYQAHSLASVTASDLQVPLLTLQKPVVSHHIWSMSVLIRCVTIVLIGGIVAGMLGFGGGMILNPLMLEMGINPLVSSATSSVMVLFSASAATFSFAVSGGLNYQYALVYGGVCAVASIFGVAVVSTSVRRSGRGSVIVFTLAFIIGIGAMMQAVFGGSEAVHDIRIGHHVSFLPLC